MESLKSILKYGAALVVGLMGFTLSLRFIHWPDFISNLFVAPDRPIDAIQLFGIAFLAAVIIAALLALDMAFYYRSEEEPEPADATEKAKWAADKKAQAKEDKDKTYRYAFTTFFTTFALLLIVNLLGGYESFEIGIIVCAALAAIMLAMVFLIPYLVEKLYNWGGTEGERLKKNSTKEPDAPEEEDDKDKDKKKKGKKKSSIPTIFIVLFLIFLAYCMFETYNDRNRGNNNHNNSHNRDHDNSGSNRGNNGNHHSSGNNGSGSNNSNDGAGWQDAGSSWNGSGSSGFANTGNSGSGNHSVSPTTLGGPEKLE